MQGIYIKIALLSEYPGNCRDKTGDDPGNRKLEKSAKILEH